MNAPNNGRTPQPIDPRRFVAEAVIEVMRAEDSDEEPFADLDEEERAAELFVAERYIAAHVAFLASQGLKIVPVGAVPVPKSEMEALAMVQAAQTFLDARKRKSKLIGGGPKKLILPPGSKLQ